MSDELAIIMKRRDRGGDVDYDDGQVHAVYDSVEKARARVLRIAAHPDNKRFTLKETGLNRWTLGPDWDEGFFGHRPVELWIVTKPLLT